MKQFAVQYEFVEQFPDYPIDGTVYISMTFATAMHRCCCGCGNQVITPLSSTGWTLSFDGRISLAPSIGNWSFPCQSHYWINRNKVDWERRWSRDKIAVVRASEQREIRGGNDETIDAATDGANNLPPKLRWWQKFRLRF